MREFGSFVHSEEAIDLGSQDSIELTSINGAVRLRGLSVKCVFNTPVGDQPQVVAAWANEKDGVTCDLASLVLLESQTFATQISVVVYSEYFTLE